MCKSDNGPNVEINMSIGMKDTTKPADRWKSSEPDGSLAIELKITLDNRRVIPSPNKVPGLYGIKIGDAWYVPAVGKVARKLQNILDKGNDPAEIEKEEIFE